METSFDIVMELLSEEENKFFQEKDNEIRKGIRNFKVISAQILSDQKKIDNFIKKHPGCDQEDDKNFEKVVDMVYDLDLRMRDLSTAFMKIYKRPGTKAESNLDSGFIYGILASFVSLIFIPFSKKLFAGILAGGIGTSVVTSKIQSVVSNKNDKKWEEKEKEWKELNPNNVYAKMEEMEDLVDKMRSALSDKYAPWMVC